MMSFAVYTLVFALGGVLGAGLMLAFERRRSANARGPVAVDTLPATEPLNKHYNELISDVSVLIHESVAKANLDREIDAARLLHKAILPEPHAHYGDVSVAGRCFPAGSCGGDWWFHRQVGDEIIVWLGDVAGHGISSALVASACAAVANAIVTGTPDLGVEKSMALMNSVLSNMTKNELHVTAVCLRLNVRTGEGTIGSASHTEVMRLDHASDKGQLLEHPINYPLAVNEREAFKTCPLKLKEGQTLFLMTDGLLEFPQNSSRTWSHKRLLAYIAKEHVATHDALGLVGLVEAMIFNHGTGELLDDITFVAISRGEPAGSARVAA